MFTVIIKFIDTFVIKYQCNVACLYCTLSDSFDDHEDVISATATISDNRVSTTSNVKRTESRREIRSPFPSLNGVPPPLSSYLITHAHTRPHQGPRTGIKLRRVRRFVTYNAPLIDQPDPPWSDVPLPTVAISSHPPLLQLSAPDHLFCPSNVVRFLRSRQFVGRQYLSTTRVGVISIWVIRAIVSTKRPPINTWKTKLYFTKCGQNLPILTVINGKITILHVDTSFRAEHKEQIELNKLQKFITSAAFYITKAKQTIIATLQTSSPF